MAVTRKDQKRFCELALADSWSHKDDSEFHELHTAMWNCYDPVPASFRKEFGYDGETGKTYAGVARSLYGIASRKMFSRGVSLGVIRIARQRSKEHQAQYERVVAQLRPLLQGTNAVLGMISDSSDPRNVGLYSLGRDGKVLVEGTLVEIEAHVKKSHRKAA